MNRKVLSTATKELNKAKAPARPKDILFDPTGQGMLNPKYAGKPVRLATDTLYNPTKYNIRAYADNGVSARLNPYDTTNVTLEGAKYIDEYPELQEGGIYMDGDLSQEEIDYYAKGGFIVEDISVPAVGGYRQGGALLTKKVTCKSCGWTWDAADGGDDVTTCHKCGGQGLIHAKKGGIISDLSHDKIQDLIEQGYVIEEQ